MFFLLCHFYPELAVLPLSNVMELILERTNEPKASESAILGGLKKWIGEESTLYFIISINSIQVLDKSSHVS